jgi:hypothetical protein
MGAAASTNPVSKWSPEEACTHIKRELGEEFQVLGINGETLLSTDENEPFDVLDVKRQDSSPPTNARAESCKGSFTSLVRN